MFYVLLDRNHKDVLIVVDSEAYQAVIGVSQRRTERPRGRPFSMYVTPRFQSGYGSRLKEVLARRLREFRSPTDGETRRFYEIVVAPKYTVKGHEVLKGKSKTLRILEAKKNEQGKLSLRQVGGGWLGQDSDDINSRRHQFQLCLG